MFDLESESAVNSVADQYLFLGNFQVQDKLFNDRLWYKGCYRTVQASMDDSYDSVNVTSDNDWLDGF